MQLKFETKIVSKYSSQSQKIRVLTEDWVERSGYCPNCGHNSIEKYENNKPVADFFCENCKEDYELKSKQNNFGAKILDGAYRTMLERLNGSNNPNFFFLSYSLANFEVINFAVIPKHFFIPEIIEKRKPLASTARRAGWVGCNILLKQIPESGKIFLVRNKKTEQKVKVLAEWQKTLFLREEEQIEAKGWLLDVMRCIDSLGKEDFVLDNVYAFEKELSLLHPDNQHIKDKIRQQLQVLRDKGYLHFVSPGKYSLSK